MKKKSSSKKIIDITPTPKILKTLGDIPFAAWQCLAELMDNSLDAFADAEAKGILIESPRIDIHWSNETVPLRDREIVVQDNGLGMELEILQNAAKAGYSSNDPISNLGLFGMGFNIATARLGDETTFLSATPQSKEWVGVKINFDQLIKDRTFSAPVVTEAKKNKLESGTKIIVRNIKEGIFGEIRRKESAIRKQLGVVYSSILSQRKLSIFVQRKQLFPRLYCFWNDARYIMRKGIKIEAVQRINRDLGETYFDTMKNRYLSEDESIELESVIQNGTLPAHIVRRPRRLKGWIGIQRYADPSEFGIDFVRNGRKILIADKSLFGYENPDTGTFTSEYPVELGSTVGGRIIGELHVDYLIPTYQKNGFDTVDRAWRLTAEAVRGAGPILPKKRQALGYDGDNESPLGKLVNGYRRMDPGTKNLAISNSLAKEFAKRFFEGDIEYDTDEKWYKAAQEADRENAERDKGLLPVNTGDIPSDDVSLYITDNQNLQDNNEGSVKPLKPLAVSPLPSDSNMDHLIQLSNKEESLSGIYSYNNTPGLEVTAWRLKNGQIKINGNRVPYRLFQDGVEIDYFYDPTHPILADYPLSPKQLLIQGLAEKFSLRDTGTSIQTAFLGLIDNHLAEERINLLALQERTYSIITSIREKLPALLGHRFSKAKEIIQQVEADEEDLAKRLLEEAPQLLQAYQDSTESASQSLCFVNESTIKRLIVQFPEEFMDNKLFAQPYMSLKIGNQPARERLRKNSLERVLLYYSDVVLFIQQSGKGQAKQELLRYANTLSLLESLLV